MTYPRVEVYLDKIKHNTKTLVNRCRKTGVEVASVTKVFCGHPVIARSMVESGVSMLADSRLKNLEKLEDIPVPKLLLRLPMLSEVKGVVKHADISLNSEIETITALSQEAQNQNKTHKIILMVDLGDLREGIFHEEIVLEAVEEIQKLSGVKLIGLGTNLTCYGGVIPRPENLSRLVHLKDIIETQYNIDLDILSGGNSSSIHLIETEKMPKDINQVRLGESLVLGRETAFGERIEGTFDDCFKLTVEVIELKEKPSIPIGEIGMDAFGNEPSFVDKGIRERALCAIGKQDVEIDDIIPDDQKIQILGGSSDHLILDVTDSDTVKRVGDKVTFNLTYGGILKVMTSEYVAKIFKD